MVVPNKNKKPESSLPKKEKDSDESDIFDRDEDSQDILDSHLGRNEREKIQNLIKKVNEQPDNENSKSKSKSNKRTKKENNQSDSDDFERESEDEDSDPKIRFPKVHAVRKEDVISQAAKILDYCNKNEIDIMEVQNVLFSNFSLTRKVSVVSLKNVLIDKFQFDSEEATLLARYMVEVPEQYKTENDEDSDKVEYRFDPDRQLSHAKVVSRLQLLMSSIMSE